METIQDHVEKGPSKRRSPRALNHTSRRFCHFQANTWPSRQGIAWSAVCLARTMPDLQCRQAADKPDGRLRPHYASPLASSMFLSNADLASRPYKIFAYPHFCACSLLSLCLAATAETKSTRLVRASTTLPCTRTMRYLHDDNRRSVSPLRDCKRLRAGGGLGFSMWSAGEMSGEDGAGAPSMFLFGDMVDSGPRHGSPTRKCTCSCAVLKGVVSPTVSAGFLLIIISL
jgi:hypothetical protein